MDEQQDRPGPRFFVAGDINGFFGLMMDNLTVMAFMAGILIHVFGYPESIVYGHMFPGTAFGVLVGDLAYTYMAYRLAKQSGNANFTAMPLGLDTPSSIGMAFAVLGPAFVGLKAEGMPETEAAMMTWYIGMATMVIIGCIKLVASFFGTWVQKIVPEAGLLGSLAGIGLVLIGLLPMLEVFELPVVGMVSLGLILYTLVAGIRLPRGFPGVAAAILAGTGLYYVLGPLGLSGGQFQMPQLELHMGLPTPSLGFALGFTRALRYLPVSVPFAILTIIGGINVTESARVGGDNFNTRHILQVDGLATLCAGLCGGVAQSTPYIGQPAYKAMGARLGYTWMTGVFIGLGGMLGYVSFIVDALPKAILAPILIFVALDIVVQAYQASPARHGPAVALAHLPTVARLLAIKLTVIPPVVYKKIMGYAVDLPPACQEIFGDYIKGGEPRGLHERMVITALGNGFILTGMMWGGFMAMLVDRRLRTAAAYMFVMAALSYVGVAHSVSLDGDMYLNPFALPDPARRVPLLFCMGYAVLGSMMFLLSFTKESQEPPGDGGHGGGHSHEHSEH